MLAGGRRRRSHESRRMHLVQRGGEWIRGGFRRRRRATRHRRGQLQLRGPQRCPHTRHSHPHRAGAEAGRRQPHLREPPDASRVSGHAALPPGAPEHLAPGEQRPRGVRGGKDPRRRHRQGRHGVGCRVREALQQAPLRLRPATRGLVSVEWRRLADRRPPPVITQPRFTGTGTRFLEAHGKDAIDELFARSFR